MYEYKANVLRVVDGDTLEVLIDLGFGVCFKEKVRFTRVNTPEVWGVKKESAEYKLGEEASGFTKGWIATCENKIVLKTTKDRKGKYGRYLAEVFADAGPRVGENLQNAIISAGYDKNSPLTYKG
jgi:micrococcal nuclease